jgi:hypothetical protein
MLVPRLWRGCPLNLSVCGGDLGMCVCGCMAHKRMDSPARINAPSTRLPHYLPTSFPIFSSLPAFLTLFVSLLPPAPCPPPPPPQTHVFQQRRDVQSVHVLDGIANAQPSFCLRRAALGQARDNRPLFFSTPFVFSVCSCLRGDTRLHVVLSVL